MQELIASVIAYFSESLVAQLVGIVATIISFMSYQCKDSKKLFLYQLIASVVWALHFGLLQQYTGVLLNCAGIIRAICLYRADKKWAASKVTMVLVMLMMAGCGAVTWTGWICIMPTIAMIAGTPAMWTQKGKLLRWVQLLCISPFWLTYNAMSGSIAGIITESLNIISVIVSFIRYRGQSLDRVGD